MEQKPVKIDAQEMDNILKMWHSFTVLMKRGSVSVVLLLILMAWFLL